MGSPAMGFCRMVTNIRFTIWDGYRTLRVACAATAMKKCWTKLPISGDRLQSFLPV